MKRLLIILLCLPLIFACKREEPFVEGEEIVLDMSVITDDVQSIATRAMGDNVVGTPALWLVVFDSNGLLVEWAKAYDFKQETPTGGGETVTYFKARLHATLEERRIHFLLNYDDDNNDATDLEFNYGHENNIIGGLIVERDRDVYWQYVDLPGINNNQDNTNTVKNYLTKVPLVRNFSKITVTETADDFELLGFYVLNVPKYATVAPFHDGEFVKYYNENANFDGQTTFTTKSYQQLDVNEGYRGTIPNVDDERIQKASDCNESITLLSPTASYYLYENRYISGDKDRTVSVLLKGKYKGTEYWYRVDLVKKNPTTGVLEYFDVLRNFSYNIKITQATAGKTSVNDAINHAAGNNVLSSLDIAHLTEISDGHALLEVNHTDTVLISHDVVYVRYKFTDDGSREGFKNNTNEDIANKAENDDCGWYLTYKGVVSPTNAPINVVFADEDDSDDWRTVTVTVNQNALKEREEVSLTFIVTSSTEEILSRTVSYTLLPQQKMLVECPAKVPEVVGSEVNVSILIPDGLPEAMFPLDFAIEAQGTNQSGTEKTYLAQHISPHKNEVMTVRTAGSIVPTFAGKKSFQYMVTFSYEDYLAATTTTRQLSGVNVLMRVFTKKFITNTAESASRVYAYNKYFDLGSDNFINGTMQNFAVSFIDDETATYGVGRTIKLNITAGEAGIYLIESNTLQSPTRAVLAELTLNAGQTQTIDLVTSTFANQGKVLVTCMATSVMKEIFAAERNKLNIKVDNTSSDATLQDATNLNVYMSEASARSFGTPIVSMTNSTLKSSWTEMQQSGLQENSEIWFAYKSGFNLYIASATVKELYEGSARLEFGDPIMIKPTISNITWTNADYYGEGKTVTLSFQTDMPDLTYSINTTSSNLTRTKTSVSRNTVTMTFTTTTWSDPASVMITANGLNVQQITGSERNIIEFGKLRLRRNNSNIDSNTELNISYGNTSVANKVRASSLTAGGYEVVVSGVKDPDKDTLTFVYNNNSNRKATAKVRELMNGITLNF